MNKGGFCFGCDRGKRRMPDGALWGLTAVFPQLVAKATRPFLLEQVLNTDFEGLNRSRTPCMCDFRLVSTLAVQPQSNVLLGDSRGTLK